MKIFIKNLEKLKSKSDNILNELKISFPFSQENNKNHLKYTKEPEFKKVECFDIKKNTGGATNNNNQKKSSSYNFSSYQFIKLEKEDPVLMTLSDKQKEVLGNYINKSLHDYHRGTIFIDDHSLKNYKNIQYAIENDTKINKVCVDFVLTDMYKSYTNEGHHGMLEQLTEDDEVLEYYSNNSNKK
jgi:hypothetical protein